MSYPQKTLYSRIALVKGVNRNCVFEDNSQIVIDNVQSVSSIVGFLFSALRQTKVLKCITAFLRLYFGINVDVENLNSYDQCKSQTEGD